MALGALPQRAVLLPRRAAHCVAPRGQPRPSRRLVVPRASDSFDLSQYQEAVVAEVKHSDKSGNIVLLRIKDTHALMPVYIGEAECGALVSEIHRKPRPRPMTHDLMKSTLDALGFRVTKVRITALVGNTYHARVHYARGGRGRSAEAGGPAAEVDVDARPSDAVNLAVRFGATIYVNREVAAKMSHPVHVYEANPAALGGSTEEHSDVVRSCREEINSFNDPTIMYKLQMQVAIAEERFEDATALRDAIDRILASDRALSLVVAMETAIDDGRYDEAARLRDEFKALRRAQQLSSSEVADL